tara:strand:+ start:167 stop:454 length:288 start_codon:yes stop_codon:yes gene_type:complete
MSIDIEKLPFDIKHNPEKLGNILLTDKYLTLIDRVKELEGAIRDITTESNFHPIKDWAICGICHNSSSGSEGRNSRMKTYYEFIELIEAAKNLID